MHSAPSGVNNQGAGGSGDADIQSTKASFDGAVLVGGSMAPRASGGKILVGEKIICHRFGVKGHSSKGYEAKVKCVVCNKETHIPDFCAWLHQRKPVATLVGFGGEGLGCFVAEHAKELSAAEKYEAVTLVRLRDA